MDYQSLMEEAKAIQEGKTKRLTKMREERKQFEMERQRKFREKQMQVQTKVPKVNRIKHNLNKSVTDSKKHNDLQVKQIKKISGEKPKIPKISRNDIKTVSNTSQILNPKIEHRSKPQKQLSEENKVSSKPTEITNKKPTALKYSELIELAKKNSERKDFNTKTKSIKTPPIPVPGRTKGTSQPITPQKRKLTEDKTTITPPPPPPPPTTTTTTPTPNKQIKTSNNQTASTQESPKNTKLQNNKNKIVEETKPRRQIEQSDFFKKTFEMKEPKKPPTPLSRPRPKNFPALANNQYIDEDDDFIVSDDDDTDFDVSAVIKNIFRYDKNKYVDDNDFAADQAMVSSYSQQQYEERRSTRIGRKEDIEDMYLEEEELRKSMKKKKSKKLKRLQ